jgi:KDO2-lipid IV(A) lauroyltransferase
MAEWLLKKAALIPRGVMWKLAEILGTAWYVADVSHRRIALGNLDLAFGDEMDNEARAALCRKAFQHLARVILELPYLSVLGHDNADEFLTFKGFEHLGAASEKGKGLLIIGSHFGNWEMMAKGVSLRHRKGHMVVRPLDNPILDGLIDWVRSNTGSRTVPKKGSALRIFRLLKQGEIVALLNDQNAVRSEAVFVPFFGELASTNKAPAAIALKTGAPVIPVHNFRQPDGRYQIVAEPEIELIRTGDTEHDIEANTALFNRIIEGHIRTHPAQWLWVHKRWRTRPKGPGELGH